MTTEENRSQSKARTALIAAFNQLVLAKPYAEFHISDVIKLADVSRSTFYEHFRSKDDILRLCLTHVLGPLAKAGFSGSDLEQLEMVLEHFQEFEEQTSVYLNGPAATVVTQRLAELIEPLLDAERDPSTAFPNRLLASQIAASTIGLVASWMNHSPRETADCIARQLQQTARALVNC